LNGLNKGEIEWIPARVSSGSTGKRLQPPPPSGSHGRARAMYSDGRLRVLGIHGYIRPEQGSKQNANKHRPNGRNINENDQKPYLLAGFPLDYNGAYVRACSVAVSGKRSCPGDSQPPPDPYVSYVPGHTLSEAWFLLGFGPEVKLV